MKATEASCFACGCGIGEGYENTKSMPVNGHTLCDSCHQELGKKGHLCISEAFKLGQRGLYLLPDGRLEELTYREVRAFSVFNGVHSDKRLEKFLARRRRNGSSD